MKKSLIGKKVVLSVNYGFTKEKKMPVNILMERFYFEESTYFSRIFLRKYLFLFLTMDVSIRKLMSCSNLHF